MIQETSRRESDEARPTFSHASDISRRWTRDRALLLVERTQMERARGKTLIRFSWLAGAELAAPRSWSSRPVTPADARGSARDVSGESDARFASRGGSAGAARRASRRVRRRARVFRFVRERLFVRRAPIRRSDDDDEAAPFGDRRRLLRRGRPLRRARGRRRASPPPRPSFPPPRARRRRRRATQGAREILARGRGGRHVPRLRDPRPAPRPPTLPLRHPPLPRTTHHRRPRRDRVAPVGPGRHPTAGRRRVDGPRARRRPRRRRRRLLRRVRARDGHVGDGVVGPPPLRDRGHHHRSRAYPRRYAQTQDWREGSEREGSEREGSEREGSERGVSRRARDVRRRVSRPTRVRVGAGAERRRRVHRSVRRAVRVERGVGDDGGSGVSGCAAVRGGRGVGGVRRRRVGRLRRDATGTRRRRRHRRRGTVNGDFPHQRHAPVPLREPGRVWDPVVDHVGVLLRVARGGEPEPSRARAKATRARTEDADVRGGGGHPEKGVATAAAGKSEGRATRRHRGGTTRAREDDGVGDCGELGRRAVDVSDESRLVRRIARRRDDERVGDRRRGRERGVKARDAVSGPTPHTLDARSGGFGEARPRVDAFASPRGARTAGAQGASRGAPRASRGRRAAHPAHDRAAAGRARAGEVSRSAGDVRGCVRARGAPATPGGGAKTRRVEDGTGGGEGGAKRRA